MPRQRPAYRPCLPRSQQAGDLRRNRGSERELTAADEDLVRAVLVAQLRSIALARLELDGNLLLVEQVGALEDDAKGALANLLADAVVDADDVGGGAATRHGG